MPSQPPRSPAQQTVPSGGAPLRIGLLNNPDSRRNRRAMPAIRTFLQTQPLVTHCEANTPEAIQSCLHQLALGRPDVLAINGGDGTVQAALTSLLTDQPFARLPLLAIVPGGNTNMTAHDVGLRGGVKQSLQRLCRWARGGQPAPVTVERSVVRVQTNPATTPRYGMFFGVGAIIRGIEYCHDKVYSLGLHDEWAPGFAALRLLFAMVRREKQFIAPTVVAIGINGEPPGSNQDCLLLLVSTLERLFLGMHPYWGKQRAPLHYTWVRSAPAHPLRAFPALLRGRPNQFGTVQAGYRSENISALQLTMDGPFTLDGELYQASIASGPVLVSHAGPIRFLRF